MVSVIQNEYSVDFLGILSHTQREMKNSLHFCLLFLGLAVLNAGPNPATNDEYTTAYNYMVRFYPRFMTFATQEHPGALINQFQAPAEPMGPEYKAVVAINDDTLYDSALVNLTEQPQVVTIPPYNYKYSIIQLDGFGSVITNTGLVPKASGGTYILVGPNQQDVPSIAGSTNIYMPYNWTTLAIRTDKYYLNSNGAYTCVTNAAQNFRSNIAILPLSSWLTNTNGGNTIVEPLSFYKAPVKTITDGIAQKGTEYFLDVLQLANAAPSTAPLSSNDLVLIRHFNTLYDSAKKVPSSQSFSKMIQGARDAHDAIIANWRRHYIGNNWVYFNNVGNWTNSGLTNYLDRASCNEFIQYGNTASTSYYAQAFLDQASNNLIGTNNYTITFSKNQIPQYTRFWSVTAYTPEDIELVPNSANKYVVASYTPGLVYEKNGSLTINISNQKPTNAARMPNWLPAPKGNFSVMLRVYGPQGSAQQGTYVPPPVVLRK